MKSTGSPSVAKRQANGLLKGPTAKKAVELLSLSRMRGLLTGHCHLKGHYKTGAGEVPCVTDANTSERVSNVLFDCESLDTLRFRHLAEHFMKPGDIEEISVRRMLYFVQSAGLLKAQT